MTVGSQVKSCYSSIKSVEASLELLASKTQELEAHEKLNQAKAIVSEVKNDLNYQVIQLTKEEPQYK
ncbi:DUF1657 domain-containing protein [Virgibacillus sp. C22-A2]|uniref:DUF1657 domain-containing protein n=1 Tax=Virgibacillus tibetensis TaxID=3042313 RepID=A0ABU6KIJ1_9BACI|nr:DUF1657 domain-containing protein [Virgibacillus sp. C22-A2]